MSRPSAARRLARWMRRTVALVVVALLVGFVAFAESLERTEAVPPRQADGIVALTGGADRVADALDLLVSGEAQRLLISGVNRATSGLEVTRVAPLSRPLLDCCIELGYAAENTVGNARETRGWVRRHNIHSLIVVTSNYHMPRALAEIGDAAPGVQLLPYPVVTDRTAGTAWWADGPRLRLVAAEYLKYLVVLARVHIAPSAPYGDRTGA